MTPAARAAEINAELNADNVKMGDIKKRAKGIRRDHELAMALWATESFHARLLATLIFDKKLLDQQALDALAADLMAQDAAERHRIAEWLLANQLMKSKATVRLLESWRDADSPILQRLFWYHQARARWTGQTPPDNTAALVEIMERDLAAAHPDVQWAMNFCAGWIGVFDPPYRARCIALGESTGLYQDEVVPKNCTPAYLPDFIRIEVEKRA